MAAQINVHTVLGWVYECEFHVQLECLLVFIMNAQSSQYWYTFLPTSLTST
jgi:hypothetical protein